MSYGQIARALLSDTERLIDFRLVGVCTFVLFLVGCLALLEKRDQRRKEQEGSEEEKNCGGSQSPPRRYPTDEEHRSAEQSHWAWQIKSEEGKDRISRLTFGFSLVATIVAGLAFWQTWRQANLIQGQLNESREEQRPWIKVESLRFQHVTINKGVIRTSIEVTYKNIGHAPASNIDIFPTSVLFHDDRSSFNQAETLCKQQWLQKHIGMDVLLPEEVTSITLILAKSVQEVFSHQASIFGPEHEIDNWIEPMFAGCITYTYGDVKVFRATGFGAVALRSEGHFDHRNGGNYAVFYIGADNDAGPDDIRTVLSLD